MFTLKDAGPDAIDSDADPATGQTDLFTIEGLGPFFRDVDCGIRTIIRGPGQTASLDLGEGEESAAVSPERASFATPSVAVDLPDGPDVGSARSIALPRRTETAAVTRRPIAVAIESGFDEWEPLVPLWVG